MLKKIGPIVAFGALVMVMVFSEASPTLATVKAPETGSVARPEATTVAEAVGAGVGGGVVGAVLGGLACAPAGALAAFTDGFLYGTAGDVAAQLFGHPTMARGRVVSTAFDH